MVAYSFAPAVNAARIVNPSAAERAPPHMMVRSAPPEMTNREEKIIKKALAISGDKPKDDMLVMVTKVVA